MKGKDNLIVLMVNIKMERIKQNVRCELDTSGVE
jgi:hypothetical protein